MNIVGRLPKVPRIMEAGDLAPWVAAFAAELGSQRHTALTISGYTACARHFAAWRTINNIGLDKVNHEALDRFMEHRCRCGGYREPMALSRKYMKRVRRFMLFLARHGVIAALCELADDAIDPHVAEFQEWLPEASPGNAEISNWQRTRS